jgi:hypothetical protein
MIFDRLMVPEDLPILEMSLAQDQHHVGTTADFFMMDGTVTKVYEDEHGPIMFVRGSVIRRFDKKVLRLDIQYVSNEDGKRNARAMFAGFDILSQRAKDHGFEELYFTSNNPLLIAFCTKRFGFVESNGELRKTL